MKSITRISIWVFWALLLNCVFAGYGRTQSPAPGDVVLSAGFTFGPLPLNGTCAPVLSWNGVPDPYPENPGEVCAFFSQNIGIGIPFQLGFLNNGFLFPCNQMTWGDITYTFGDGTHVGDTYMQPADTTCPYFTDEYGGNTGDHVLAGFGIIANYTLVQKRRCVRGFHGTCFQYQYYLAPVLTGGQGTATETQLAPSANLLTGGGTGGGGH